MSVITVVAFMSEEQQAGQTEGWWVHVEVHQASLTVSQTA